MSMHYSARNYFSRSVEATSRVLNAIEDDRYGTVEGRRLQRLEDSGGPRF